MWEKKGLGYCILPTVSNVSHRLRDVGGLAPVLELTGRVLTTTVRVADDFPTGETTAVASHHKRLDDQVGTHVLIECPADDLTV